MPAFFIIESKVLGKTVTRFRNIAVRLQINIFSLHTPPQPFSENVVHAPSSSVHADFDFGGFKNAGILI